MWYQWFGKGQPKTKKTAHDIRTTLNYNHFLFNWGGGVFHCHFFWKIRTHIHTLLPPNTILGSPYYNCSVFINTPVDFYKKSVKLSVMECLFSACLVS